MNRSTEGYTTLLEDNGMSLEGSYKFGYAVLCELNVWLA